MGFLPRLALLVQTLYPALALATDAAAPPSLPRITSVQYSGNGCPDDASRKGDFNDPTFRFDSFAASFPGAGRTVNCEVHVQAAGATAGWQVALSQVNVDGRLVLDPGVGLVYFTQAYFSDDAADTATARGSINNDGSSRINRAITINQGIGDKVWSDCIGDDGSPGILNVNFRTVLNGDSGRGSFEVFTENWDFVWRKC